MKLRVLFALAALLGVFLPRYEFKAIDDSSDVRGGPSLTKLRRPVLPILMRLGEEYFIRLDGAKQTMRAAEQSSPPRATTVNRAIQLHLRQRLLQDKVDEPGNGLTESFTEQVDSAERERRADEPPISLDLTFHLLREVLEMARAEQLAQQASNNRKMMDFFGK